MGAAIRTHIARRVGRWVRSRPADIAWPRGVVSFTFDDFPKSALATGGAILESYGFRGTYYAALGVAGRTGDMGKLHDLDDIRTAHAHGHEIACHTYSHLDCSRASSRAILADIAENKAVLAALIDGAALTNFAYPFGGLSLAAKQLLSAHFDTCRGIGGGINRGTVDLANLGSSRIYHGEFDMAALRRLIDENRSVGGWLIFYTHDVAATPSRYGCTPGDLEAVVAYAAQCCEVLPVRAVVPRFSAARQPAPIAA
jgi:peptidoglycan/xylan/chitin deacetylase (PgdA/CDA1 family)